MHGSLDEFEFLPDMNVFFALKGSKLFIIILCCTLRA